MIVLSHEVTDSDEKLLNRFYRVLFALKNGPLKTTAAFPVSTCHKEVRSAITSGFIEQMDAGYTLTPRGLEALEAQLKLMRQTSGG